VDYGPDYITDDCYWERLPTGELVKRCPLGSMGAGDILPTIVTPSDAKAAIDQTESGYDQLNLSVLASNAPPEFKGSWAIQYANAKTFATGARASVGFLNTTAVMQQNDKYQQQLVDWGKSFAAIGGAVPAGATLPPGQAAPGTGENSLANIFGSATGLVVATGVVLAGIYLAGHAK
jgi:hypothetical protein